jgi:hypothetical protein
MTLLGIGPRFLGLPACSPVIILPALSRIPYIVGSKYFQIRVKYHNISKITCKQIYIHAWNDRW